MVRATINRWLFTGCVLAGIAVGLGAWAAHGLDSAIAGVYGEETKEVFGRTISAVEKYVGDFRTGVTYQMWHALALIAVAPLSGRVAGSGRWCLLLGTLIFSGSLYILVLSGVRIWGAVTPIGGVLLLVGWTLLAIAACRQNSDITKPEHSDLTVRE